MRLLERQCLLLTAIYREMGRMTHAITLGERELECRRSLGDENIHLLTYADGAALAEQDVESYRILSDTIIQKLLMP